MKYDDWLGDFIDYLIENAGNSSFSRRFKTAMTKWNDHLAKTGCNVPRSSAGPRGSRFPAGSPSRMGAASSYVERLKKAQASMHGALESSEFYTLQHNGDDHGKERKANRYAQLSRK